MSNKNIDKLFQSKLSDFEVSKEGNWPLFKHLLKEQQAKMKIIRQFKMFFFSLTSLVFISVIAFFIWNNGYMIKKHIMPKKMATEENTIVSKKTISQEKTIEKKNFTSLFFNKLNNEPKSLKVNTDNKNTKPFFTKSLNENNPLKEEFTKSDISLNSKLSESSIYLKSDAYSSFTYVSPCTVKTTISNLGKEINSSFDDYAPVISADGSLMYFTSRRPVTEKEIRKNSPSKENIYFTSFNTKNQKWAKPELLSSPINKFGRFNSAVALSNDGQRIFIYRDNKLGKGNIYESNFNGELWTEPVKLPEPINSKFLETSASITADGNTIYFVSNRDGGQGGLDIWYCSKNDEGNWGKAINMGSTINSPSDEEGVFIHPDGKTLYFSSRGHQGFGGYDIFYSQFVDNKWTKPKNLGENINTSNDDVYFVMEANGKVGYYSSIKKEGLGEKDIYRIDFSYPENENKSQLILLKGVIMDKENPQTLEAEIKITDIETNKTIITATSNSLDGKFIVSLSLGKSYGIYVSTEDYLFYSDNINIPDTASYNEISKTILLQKLITESKIILNNIFYDYGKYNLTKNSRIELNRLYDFLITNPRLKIEISAHTDSRSSDEFNNKLSQQRAQVCVDYLLQKGINNDRITAKGYGKQQLLISDKEIATLKSEEEKENAHQKNRRTEFKIIEK